MALAISTFSKDTGGATLFKALGHPLAVDAALNVRGKLSAARHPVAYDPHGVLPEFDALYPLGGAAPRQLFVQDMEQIGQRRSGCVTEAVTALPDSGADLLFVPSFDSKAELAAIGQRLPSDCAVVTLDSLRLPERMLSDPSNYLSPINFATNLLWFRDGDGGHMRLNTVNYWGLYGAERTWLWCRLFDADGAVLAEFEQAAGPTGASIIIDSQAVRKRHRLGDFCGQILIHVVGAAGHDIVKYTLDEYGDETGRLSCTHDANAWPAMRYAGLPAPRAGERLLLWVQNAHPTPIPSGAIGCNRMGRDDDIRHYNEEIPPFGTRAIDVGELWSELCWPQQLEVRAGRHVVRPRYELLQRESHRRHCSHINIERDDLSANVRRDTLTRWAGKGYLLPAPVLPTTEFQSECLPTPMSLAQHELPLRALVYDSGGQLVAEHSLGRLPRDHAATLDLGGLASDALAEACGHVELCYEPALDGDVDGWLHALFRYTLRASNHVAETSFGAHLFNHPLVYRDEPQSYRGPAPGLTTRLYLRLAPAPAQTFCQLIYPISERWHDHSATALSLFDGGGHEVARHSLQIPASGSALLCMAQLFDDDQRRAAGDRAWLQVRDTSCRLFGYQWTRAGDAFALDHLFGF